MFGDQIFERLIYIDFILMIGRNIIPFSLTWSKRSLSSEPYARFLFYTTFYSCVPYILSIVMSKNTLFTSTKISVYKFLWYSESQFFNHFKIKGVGVIAPHIIFWIHSSFNKDLNMKEFRFSDFLHDWTQNKREFVIFSLWETLEILWYLLHNKRSID